MCYYRWCPLTSDPMMLRSFGNFLFSVRQTWKALASKAIIAKGPVTLPEAILYVTTLRLLRDSMTFPEIIERIGLITNRQTSIIVLRYRLLNRNNSKHFRSLPEWRASHQAKSAKNSTGCCKLRRFRAFNEIHCWTQSDKKRRTPYIGHDGCHFFPSSIDDQLFFSQLGKDYTPDQIRFSLHARGWKWGPARVGYGTRWTDGRLISWRIHHLMAYKAAVCCPSVAH